MKSRVSLENMTVGVVLTSVVCRTRPSFALFLLSFLAAHLRTLSLSALLRLPAEPIISSKKLPLMRCSLSSPLVRCLSFFLFISLVIFRWIRFWRYEFWKSDKCLKSSKVAHSFFFQFKYSLLFYQMKHISGYRKYLQVKRSK